MGIRAPSEADFGSGDARHRRPILADGRPDEVMGRFYLTGFALDLVDD